MRSPAPTDYASEYLDLRRTGEDEAASAEPSDEVLLRALGTDRAALGPLYDRYGGLVYGLARAILQSQHEAEDLTQEVFVMLCQGSTYDVRRGSLGAFLTTLTRSRAIDRLRRRGRRLRILRASWRSAPPPDVPAAPVDRIATRECSERVRGAVAELPANERRVLAAAAERVRAPATRAPRRVVWSRFAAAAAAVLALAFGFDAYRVRRDLALERELTATLHEPNVVRSFALAGTGGAYGTVALDLDAKRGAVVVKGLRALPPGERYRLWAQVGERSVFCGEFGASAAGTIVAQFPVPVESYTAPIAKLFLTKESTPRGPAPAGPTVMESA